MNAPQMHLFMARLDRLQEYARHPGKVCQSGIYEQIMKSFQNQGQILRKSYFGFLCGKSIPTPVSKSGHYIGISEKRVEQAINKHLCLA